MKRFLFLLLTLVATGALSSQHALAIDRGESSATYEAFFWATDGGPLGLSGVSVTIDGQTVEGDFGGLSVLTGLADGTYSYTASKTGFVTQTGEVTITGANVEVFLTMAPAYEVFFWATDGGPLGLSGVSVTIGDQTVEGDFGGLSVLTGLGDGTYSYTASKTGFVTQTGEVTVSGANVEVFLTMAPAYEVFFWATDGGPLGLSGVSVTIGDQTVEGDFGGLSVLTGLGDGTYSYTASKTGFATQTGEVTVSGANVEVFLTMAPAYEVFFWATDGGPLGLSGVSVTIGDQTVEGDFGGLSVLTGLGDGTYTYTASKTGFATQTGEVTVSGANVEVFLTMAPAYEVFFWATDGGPLGLSGVSVTIGDQTVEGDFGGLSVLTGLGDGTYTYTASKTGFVTQTGEVTVSGANVEVFLTMAPAYEVFFWATDGGPLGLSGVSVTIGDQTVEGDFGGLSVLTGLGDGTYAYTASKTGFVTQTGEVTVSGANVEVFLTMAPAYEVFFWATDGGPLGLSGVSVTIGDQTVEGDFGGLSVLTGLGDGTYAYTASKTGFVTQTGEVTVSGANVEVFLAMELAYEAAFLATDGGPVGLEGVEVDVDGMVMVSGADGAAVFEGLGAGVYNYAATKDGYRSTAGTFEIVNADVAIQLVLPMEYEVSFSVTDFQGNLEAANIAIDDQDLTTDVNGASTIQLIDGSYDYTVTKDGYADLTGTIEVAGAAVNEVVAMAKESMVQFVVDDHSNLLAGAKIVFNDVEATTDAQGAASFEGILNGTYDYSIELEGYLLVEGSTVIENQDVAIEESMDLILSANEAIQKVFTFYPNPATTQLSVQFKNKASVVEVSILNLNGKVVYRQQLEGNQAAEVDVSGLEKGIYLIQVVADKESFVSKFIKE